MQKTPRLSYPGELPDLDHQTISLRTQLRLSYETYSWLRYVTWTGLLLLALLLVILPGGFPPRAAVLFWQTLPLTGRLVALHGSAALFSLAALAAQACTWLVLWGLLIAVCNSLARYTWRLSRAQSFLAASAWLPSSALANEDARRGRIPIRPGLAVPDDSDTPASVCSTSPRQARSAGPGYRQDAWRAAERDRQPCSDSPVRPAGWAAGSTSRACRRGRVLRWLALRRIGPRSRHGLGCWDHAQGASQRG